MENSLGRSHPLVKRVRALRRDAALRRSEASFLAEGLHLVEEALAGGAPIEHVLVTERLEAKDAGKRLLEQFRQAGIRPDCVAGSVMDALQDARTPQPVLAVIRRPDASLPADPFAQTTAPLIVVCIAVQDPGNLGSLQRTADAAGADAFVVCADGADPFHPRTVRASAGSVFRLPAVQIELTELLEWSKQHGLLRIGAVARDGTPYDRCDLAGPTVLFFGREATGLPIDLIEQLDQTSVIPMRSGVESLSINAAAAVVLFEAARQRGQR
jgi:TrmH family RNA methyltransferase